MSKGRALGIELSPGITATHLWAYLYAVLISSAFAGAFFFGKRKSLHGQETAA